MAIFGWDCRNGGRRVVHRNKRTFEDPELAARAAKNHRAQHGCKGPVRVVERTAGDLPVVA